MNRQSSNTGHGLNGGNGEGGDRLLGADENRYLPLGLPNTRGLDVDSRGFFNGDWLSLSFSVSA